jgi:hypothetical protein
MGSVFIRSRSVMDLALGSRSIDLEFNWREHDYSVGEDVKKVKSFVDNQKRHLPTVSNLTNVQQLFLSASQRRAHNIVERFISRPYEERKTTNLLLSIVSVAGGGKTVLLNCISNLLDKNHIRHQNIAATGSASAGINGRTIHSAFNLGPKSGNFEKLCNSESVSFLEKENFRDCEFVIIEEFFMLSAALLNFINHRLQSIFNDGRPFGNCSIIGAGDPAQLMPIAFAALYSSPEGVSECQQEGIELYRKFRVCRLESNFRQKDDIKFQELLSNVRFKCVTREDLVILESRLYKNLSEEEKEKFKSAIRLYPTNARVEAHNQLMLAQLQTPLRKLEPEQRPLHPKIKTDCFFLGEDVRVQLTRNLDIAHGLYRGLQGTIKGWMHDNNSLAVVLVQFDQDYRGATLQGLVPITKVVDYVWDATICKNIRFTAFPLVNCYASTIHKAQGTTLPLAVSCFGASEQFINQSYVVLSRVRRLEDICFDDEYLVLSRFTDWRFMKLSTIILQEYLRLGLFPLRRGDTSSEEEGPPPAKKLCILPPPEEDGAVGQRSQM